MQVDAATAARRRITLRASGYPRPIPGVPPERNLKGLSFAVANATGLLCLHLSSAALRSSPSSPALRPLVGRVPSPIRDGSARAEQFLRLGPGPPLASGTVRQPLQNGWCLRLHDASVAARSTHSGDSRQRSTGTGTRQVQLASFTVAGVLMRASQPKTSCSGSIT